VGLLAAIRLESAVVHRRPRVAILATGDEVVDAGCDLRPGQFWNSNSPLLAAMVRRFGGEPILLGVAQDSTDSFRVKLSEARGADLLITTGGVSVGDYDLVKDVLRSEGRVEIWQVRIKPGKPLAFGWFADTPIVGLPGNPVAAAVACEQFCRPVILKKMLGRRNLSPPTILTRVQKRVENFGGRRHFVRVRIDASSEGYVAYPASAQGASMLSSLAFTNGPLIVPEEMMVVELGTSLPVQMLDWDID
jgi:molybdopterin molybdotransferase